MCPLHRQFPALKKNLFPGLLGSRQKAQASPGNIPLLQCLQHLGSHNTGGP